MDFSRLGSGETVAGVAGIALIIVMFLPWFAGSGIETQTTQVAPGVEVNTPTRVDNDVSAWDSLQDFDGFLLALAGASGIALAGLAAAGRRVAIGGLPRGAITLGLGLIGTAIVLWRMLANPGDLKIGIFLGLIAVAAVAAGAYRALQDNGVEALETVPGGRTRASSSKPAAGKTGSDAETETPRKRPS